MYRPDGWSAILYASSANSLYNSRLLEEKEERTYLHETNVSLLSMQQRNWKLQGKIAVKRIGEFPDQNNKLWVIKSINLESKTELEVWIRLWHFLQTDIQIFKFTVCKIKLLIVITMLGQLLL
jgi:hypothetical protein